MANAGLFAVAFSLLLFSVAAVCYSDADCSPGMYCEMITSEWGSCRGTPLPSGQGDECITGNDCPDACRDGELYRFGCLEGRCVSMGYTYCPTGKCATMQGCEATAGSGPASDYYCYSDYDCPAGHMCLGGECIEYAFDGPQACCTGIVLLAAGAGLGLVARAKVK